MKSILSVILLCVVPGILADIGRFEKYPGKNCEDNNLTRGIKGLDKAITPELCARMCLLFEDCDTFVFNSDNACFPKSAGCDVDSLVPLDRADVYKVKSGFDQFEKHVEKDCMGNDIEHLPSSSLAECVQLCLDRGSSCVAFMHRTSDNFCLLKSACDVTSLTCLSGYDVYSRVEDTNKRTMEWDLLANILLKAANRRNDIP